MKIFVVILCTEVGVVKPGETKREVIDERKAVVL